MLIRLAGLDPAVAATAEMDELDPRYALVRTYIPGWWTTHYYVVTWREAVSFYMPTSKPELNIMRYQLTIFVTLQKLLAPSSFRLATPEELTASREHTSFILEGAKAWSCKYCQDFFLKETAEASWVVLAHLKERRVCVFTNSGPGNPNFGLAGMEWRIPGSTKTVSFAQIAGHSLMLRARYH